MNKKIIKLKESDIVHIVTKIVNEQSFNQKPLPKSDYLGQGRTFERTNLYGGKSFEEYQNVIKNTPSNRIKKVSIIFPKEGWETFAVNLIRKFGIITGFYKSLDSAKKFINYLIKRNIKADELIIGSHGAPGTLLITQQGDYSWYDNSFLEDIKGIIHNGSKVFFTACYGADYLDTLKDASERLGTGVYGASGVYNYITNNSENGFYYCKPDQIKTNKKFIQPIEHIDDKYLSFFFINIDDSLRGLEYEKGQVVSKSDIPSLQYYIEVSKSVFGLDMRVFGRTTSANKTNEYQTSMLRETKHVTKYAINLHSDISDYFARELHTIPKAGQLYDKWTKDENRMNFMKIIKSKFDSGEIKVYVELQNIKTDIKSLKPIEISDEITNDFLLENGYCSKVDGSPISWVDKIITQ